MSDEGCNALCQRDRPASTCDATAKYVLNLIRFGDLKDMQDYVKWMIILRDGVWAAAVSFLLMAIILFIRYRTVHHTARKQPSKYKEFDGPSGESTTEMQAVSDLGYDSHPSTEPPSEEGNPF